jgi:hypothetical protein
VRGSHLAVLPTAILLDDRVSPLACRVYLTISLAEDIAGRCPPHWRLIDLLGCTKAAFRKALQELVELDYAEIRDGDDVATFMEVPVFVPVPTEVLGARQ